MSYSSVKVVFPDGLELYTIGDSSTIVMDRLCDSEEAAWDAYAVNNVAFKPVTSEERTIAKENDVDVECWTKYGSLDSSWIPMNIGSARANYEKRVLTLVSSYDEEHGAWWKLEDDANILPLISTVPPEWD